MLFLQGEKHHKLIIIIYLKLLCASLAMSSSPDVILQEGGLVYSALSSDYQDVAYELVASCFVSEPISMHVEHDQNVRLRDALAFTKYFAEPVRDICLLY